MKKEIDKTKDCKLHLITQVWGSIGRCVKCGKTGDVSKIL